MELNPQWNKLFNSTSLHVSIESYTIYKSEIEKLLFANYKTAENQYYKSEASEILFLI